MNDHKPVYLTPEGLDAIKAELQDLLKVRRPALAARLHVAIKQGDLSENADYIAAKEEQGFMEGRILELQMMIRNVKLIDQNCGMDGHVTIGCHVTVIEEGEEEPEMYHVVGPTEADPMHGRISYESPLGIALLGHTVGDRVAVRAPAGEIHFKVLEIK